MSAAMRAAAFVVNAGWSAAGFALYTDTGNSWWLAFAVAYTLFALLALVSIVLYDLRGQS